MADLARLEAYSKGARFAPMKRFMVSIIQYDVTPDPYANVTNLEKLFAIAGGRRSRFVLLPELFGVGFNYSLYPEMADHNMEMLKYLQGVARKYGFYLIAGSVAFKAVKGSKTDQYYNRSYLISPEGGVMGHYDKVHVFFQNQEDQYFIPGTKSPVFTTSYAPIGIQICFDIRFPENIREMVKQGMKILFVPAQFPHPRKEHWMNLLKARAIENQIYVVGANRVGTVNEDLSYFGHSVIIDPYGDTLANGYEKEGVISEYLDMDFLEAYRKSFPVLKWL